MNLKQFPIDQNNLAFHLGAVVPPSADETPFCSRSLANSKVFVAQSVHIKLASPQAARLSKFFIGKSEVVLHLHEVPELRIHYW